MGKTEMGKKVVVIAVNTSWNIYNFRINLAKAIEKQGYKVVIVAPHDEYTKYLQKDFDCYHIHIHNSGTNPFEDIKTIYDFYQLYKQIKPSLVLNYTIKPNIYSSLACIFLGIKNINNITGLGTIFIKDSVITQIAKKMYKYSQKNTDTIFFQNIDDFKLFQRENIINNIQSEILPGSGVDTKKFRPLVSNRNDNKIKFIHISRLIWEKGIKEYVDVAKEIKKHYKNVEFYVLGFLNVQNSGAVTQKDIDSWVDSGTITYLGTTDDVKSVIHDIDCIVLASYYREGTPRILLEGASMGKPIITTNSIGCRDVVEDGVTGYLVETRDKLSLYASIVKFLKLSEKERKIMGMKSRAKMVKEFDEEIVISKYINAIDRAISTEERQKKETCV